MLILGSGKALAAAATVIFPCVVADTAEELVAEVVGACDRDTTLLSQAWVLLVQDTSAQTVAEISLVNALVSENGTHYPAIHFRSPLPQTALHVGGDARQTVATFRGLMQHQLTELIQVIVLPQNSSEADQVGALSSLNTALKPLCGAKPAPVPAALLTTLRGSQHYTHSERLQLERLCKRFNALYGHWPLPEHTSGGSAHETLGALDTALAEFSVRYT